MNPIDRAEIESAQKIVYEQMPATPQYEWPQLSQKLGCKVWLKHENHTPVGAFKIRGGLVYLHELLQREPHTKGLICATRGNHGQSVAFAAKRYGLHATIVVPHGNSREKNNAMRALGAELIEHGDEFQTAKEFACQLAQRQGLHMVPSYHRDLVRGVATGWIEFFQAVQPDDVLVPIGMGSGFSACAAARRYCGLQTRIIGVVSAHATAYLQSWQAGAVCEAPVTTQLADGLACRVPDEQALQTLLDEAYDVVAVSDTEIAQAMRLLFAGTHNVAEGAGAAAFAAVMANPARFASKCVGLALTGGNVDSDVFAQVLQGQCKHD